MTTLHWIGLILVGWVSCNVLSILLLKLTVKLWGKQVEHGLLIAALMTGPLGLLITVTHMAEMLSPIKRIADFINKG